MPDSIKFPDYAKDGQPKNRLAGRLNIPVLNMQEQDAMRKVCRLAREVLDIAAREIKPGVTTDFIDEVVHKACIDRDVREPHIVNVSMLTTNSHILHRSTTSVSQSRYALP